MFECCKSKPKLDKEFNPKPTHTRNERLLVFAAGTIGTKEYKGAGKSNPEVEMYHAYAREDNDLTKGMSDDVPWCSSVNCYWHEMVGMGSTNSKTAKSWLKWGVSTLKNPTYGDSVVFDRGGWKGHVGIIVSWNSQYVWVLGGNQSDAINVTKYSRSRLVDIRRSSKMPKLDDAILKRLKNIADNIIKGNKVSLAGSMA